MDFIFGYKYRGTVAPYTGAWIEMGKYRSMMVLILEVAPYTGAWIEIAKTN